MKNICLTHTSIFINTANLYLSGKATRNKNNYEHSLKILQTDENDVSNLNFDVKYKYQQLAGKTRLGLAKNV